jgi:hypothetical protein
MPRRTGLNHTLSGSSAPCRTKNRATLRGVRMSRCAGATGAPARGNERWRGTRTPTSSPRFTSPRDLREKDRQPHSDGDTRVVPPAGIAWPRKGSSRPRCAPQMLFTRMRGEETGERLHFASDRACRAAHRRSAHRSDHGYGRTEVQATRREQRSKSSIKLPISPV